MTEQEFRERLKRAARNDGLSPERQMQVLARREGDESKVRNWHNAKYIVAIALLLAMGATGAVAGGIGMVDWRGRPFQHQKTNSDRRVLDLMGGRTNGKVKSVQKWYEEKGTYLGATALGIDSYASSLEELKAWVTADGTLPWPVNIPKKYQMIKGRVHHVSGAEGEFRLLEQEVTEDGYITSYFAMPNEHCFIDSYTIYLQDNKDRKLEICLTLVGLHWQRGFPAEDGSTFTELNVDGMVEAIAIESASGTRLALRQEIWPPLTYKTVKGLPDGVVEEHLSEYDCLEIEITGHGSPADLLAIFGLESK